VSTQLSTLYLPLNVKLYFSILVAVISEDILLSRCDTAPHHSLLQYELFVELFVGFESGSACNELLDEMKCPGVDGDGSGIIPEVVRHLDYVLC